MFLVFSCYKWYHIIVKPAIRYSICLLLIVLLYHLQKYVLVHTAKHNQHSISLLRSDNGNYKHQRKQLHQEIQFPKYKVDNTSEIIHVIVLVHGHSGTSEDMRHLKAFLEEESETHNAKLQQPSPDQKVWNLNQTTSTIRTQKSQFIVHTAVANSQDGNHNGMDKQTDGIVAGGTRLAEEVHNIFEQLLLSTYSTSTINQQYTLSMIGYSLGGLWARYAISKLYEWQHMGGDEQNPNNQNPPKINFRVFATVATPNIGQQDLTYAFIPRPLTYTLLSIYDNTPTSNDLYGLRGRDIISQMCLLTQFTEPLQQFSKRIAYGNVYGTDAIVAPVTSLFLANGDDTIHEIIENNNNSNSTFVALTVKTPKRHDPKLILLSRSSIRKFTSYKSMIKEMSNRLDSLGWTKTFVDFRSITPTILGPARDENNADTSTLKRDQKYVSSTELCKEFCYWDHSSIYNPFYAHLTIMMTRDDKGSLFLRKLSKDIIEGITTS